MVDLRGCDKRQNDPRAKQHTYEDLFVAGDCCFAHHDNGQNERYGIDGDASNDE